MAPLSKRRATRPLLALCAWLLAQALLAPDAAAQSKKLFPLIPPPGGGTDPRSRGTIVAVEDPRGPDRLTVSVNGLAPNLCYAMFLTNDPTTGSTPGSLLGQFCANPQGRGRISVLTEVFDGFVFLNERLDGNRDGVVVGQGAGVLSQGGFMVPTRVIRIYRARAENVPTVFSGAAGSPGGLHTLSSPILR